MNKPLVALIGSIGIALIITASTRTGTHAPAVINSLAHGGSQLERASLGESGA